MKSALVVCPVLVNVILTQTAASSAQTIVDHIANLEREVYVDQSVIVWMV